ncbi:DNA-protecting protein DprA [Candidatus Gracilibacteria bacterium]|nr:DNA-protecting protein DprA [Candidatus Gracilibacteria bacterium]
MNANHRYYLGFNRVAGIGPTRLRRLIEICGSVQAAWQANAAAMIAAGLDARSSRALLTAQRTLDLDAELLRVERAGVHLLCIEDEAYPRLVAEAPAAPPVLYVRGELKAQDDWAVAIVGTRSPTSYGKEATYRIAYDLAASGVVVVSGLALGVDTIAHQAALEAGGRTIAVLGSGIDRIYPERNRRLGEQIVAQGALISDYPLGTAPAPLNFPPRNRIISALTLATLVIEAGGESGALITVGFALDQGREVFAVPGSIFSRTSVGTHQLIRDGATLARGADDILAELDLQRANVQRATRDTLPDDPVEAAVLSLLRFDPQTIDDLGIVAGLPAAQIAATLAMLELKGLARQAGAFEYVRK